MCIAADRGTELGRNRARHIMQQSQLVSCQQPKCQ